jgi:hypothetical protein
MLPSDDLPNLNADAGLLNLVCCHVVKAGS